MKKREWNGISIAYLFVYETFRYKDMTPQSLRKTHFSHNRQLNTTFTLHCQPKIII
jgi:hypothetical protein